MEKNTVTRAFSMGTSCIGTKSVPPGDFSAARRHSSSALLLATSSSKSLECSIGSDIQTSRDNIFTNVLTPDSIPEFTIPKLSVQTGLRYLKAKEPEESFGSSGTELPYSKLTSSSSVNNSVLSVRKAERSISDPLSQRRCFLQREVSFAYFHGEAQHCLDPASRAALSLPHLNKVSTPYGFITLSQSPQMVSEEALLCQAGLRHLNKDKETSCSLSKPPGTRTEDLKANCSHLSAAEQSKDSKTKGRLRAPSASLDSPSYNPRQTADSKVKRRFYGTIRKHFTSHKE